MSLGACCISLSSARPAVPRREAACAGLYLSPVMSHRHLIFTGFASKHLPPAVLHEPLSCGGVCSTHAFSRESVLMTASSLWLGIDANSFDEFQSLWIVTVVSAREAGLELRLNQLARTCLPFQAAPHGWLNLQHEQPSQGLCPVSWGPQSPTWLPSSGHNSLSEPWPVWAEPPMSAVNYFPM